MNLNFSHKSIAIIKTNVINGVQRVKQQPFGVQAELGEVVLLLHGGGSGFGEQLARLGK